ncbi:hypothetical protein EVA_22656, partial [gut metagenome]
MKEEGSNMHMLEFFFVYMTIKKYL